MERPTRTKHGKYILLVVAHNITRSKRNYDFRPMRRAGHCEISTVSIEMTHPDRGAL